MQEFKIEIEIDEEGSLKAETKGMEGEVCVNEIENILKGIDGEMNSKNKPEFYKKVKVSKKLKLKS